MSLKTQHLQFLDIRSYLAPDFSYDDFIKGRNVLKITKTTARNQDIIRITQKCKHETWDSLFFNCEDYVLEIVDGHRRSDARDAWKIAALGVAILLLL